jgi:hypothetical protein
MVSRAVWVLMAVLVLSAGCQTATSQPGGEAPVTDFKQVAGAWRTTGASAMQGSLIIQTNGKYWMRIGYTAAFQGQFRLEGGALHYDLGPTGPRKGTAMRVEDRGRELIRLTDETGQTWMECERNL